MKYPLKGMGRALGLAGLLVLAALGFFGRGARADHGDDPNVGDIVLTVPGTYALCPSGAEGDTVSWSNAGARWLKGFIQLDFVVPNGGGRQMVQQWSVLQGGDHRLDFTYPAWEMWPAGFFEMHRDLSLEVYPSQTDAEAGINKLGAIGPGHGWDIFIGGLLFLLRARRSGSS